ncbi:MAG TPA: hypothetical protein VLZ72_03765 [Flavobacterium sp.]|nr:hypothetical protein [Flavobacterium sp.]
MNLLKTILIIFAFTLVSCNNSTQKETSENQTEQKNTKSNSKDPIVFTIDGKTRSISDNKREVDVANLDESPIRYLFRKRTIKGEKSQFEIDFVFSDKENLSELPKTYDLTEDPSLHSIASLSFFDFERKVEKSSNKRLIFDKGTITIHELSSDKIHFEYEGEVHELMNNQNRFPVSGQVNVNY